MPYVPFSFPLTKGLDRSAVPCKSDPASFYTLQNFRHSRTAFGSIEQTPRWTLNETMAQGTYWTGSGSGTEPTASAIRWHQSAGTAAGLGDLTFTDYIVLRNSIQIPCIHQITTPATAGVTKGCLLVVESTAAWTVTLGNTYDVEIDGTATFKWRVNGGAYTTLVAINMTSGNSIDGGGVRLYWLASTGFTVTDAWSGRGADRVYSNRPAL